MTVFVLAVTPTSEWISREESLSDTQMTYVLNSRPLNPALCCFTPWEDIVISFESRLFKDNWSLALTLAQVKVFQASICYLTATFSSCDSKILLSYKTHFSFPHRFFLLFYVCTIFYFPATFFHPSLKFSPLISRPLAEISSTYLIASLRQGNNHRSVSSAQW